MNRATVIPAAAAAAAAVACSPGTAARTTGARPFRARIRVPPGIPRHSRVGQPRAGSETQPGIDTDRSQQWDHQENHWPFDKTAVERMKL